MRNTCKVSWGVIALALGAGGLIALSGSTSAAKAGPLSGSYVVVKATTHKPVAALNGAQEGQKQNEPPARVGTSGVMAPLVGEQRGALEVTSKLGRKLYALPDDAEVIEARKKLAADPQNPKLALALSLAEAGRKQYREAVATCTKGLAASPNDVDLLIERGHREVGLREFVAAQRDLERAAALDPKKLGAFYHLGLAHYFQGQFSAAADAFRKGLALATNNDDVIDCSNWLYVSLRRANKPEEAAAVLKRITPEMKNKEPHLAFYLRLLRLYQGSMPEQRVLPPKPANPSDLEAELAYDTVAYGVGNWHLYNDDLRRAQELFKQVVTGDAWNAWGFVGSETELARMKAAGR
jgi:tetratricopeptide (TPR) repeat protein